MWLKDLDLRWPVSVLILFLCFLASPSYDGSLHFIDGLPDSGRVGG